MNKKTKTIFLLAGRTGGPIMPLLATFKGILEVEKSENQNINQTESQFEAVIIGIKNGFEEKLAKQENLKLELLPEAKLELLSFAIRFEKIANWKHNLSQISEFLVGIGKFIGMIYLLLNSVLGSFWLIWKYKPTAILSSGSFLAIPVLWSSHIWNFVNFKNIFGQKILIITHQQDPIPGLASRLTFGLGILQTCVFDYSKKWKNFQNATIIPNPLDFAKFENTTKIKNQELADFLEHFLDLELIKNNKIQDKKKQNSTLELQNNFKNNLQRKKKTIENVKIRNQKLPLFLIFGGGSGSEFVNNWVWQNLGKLTQNFRILHLSGIYTNSQIKPSQKEIEIHQKTETYQSYSKNWQNKNSEFSVLDKNFGLNSGVNESNYFQISNLLEDMPNVLKSADLVMCRAGLGSISELLYLSKPAFLVPLENSHQEKNAEIVSQFFEILCQKNSNKWLETILQNYPQKFAKINYPNQEKIQEKLTKYYQKNYQLIKDQNKN